MRAKPLSARKPQPSNISDDGSGTVADDGVAVTAAGVVPELMIEFAGVHAGFVKSSQTTSPKTLPGSIPKGPPVVRVGGVPSVKPPTQVGGSIVSPHPKPNRFNINSFPSLPVNVRMKSPPLVLVKKFTTPVPI